MADQSWPRVVRRAVSNADSTVETVAVADEDVATVDVAISVVAAVTRRRPGLPVTKLGRRDVDQFSLQPLHLLPIWVLGCLNSIGVFGAVVLQTKQPPPPLVARGFEEDIC